MDVNSMLNYIIPPLAAAIVAALGVVTKAFWDWIKSKTHNAALDKYTDRANDAIMTAVAETMQTFVTTMKNEGKWDAETAQKAFTLSLNRAKEIMGAAALKALPEVVGDVEAWITAKIEAATLDIKTGMIS